MLDRKLAGILEIYEKFQGVDPRDQAMKIFPAVHYSMGGLWVDYERTAEGGLRLGSPRNQQTNIPGIFAIGECDYQYHGANRLGANSLLSCIFSGLIVAPGHRRAGRLAGRAAPAAEEPSSLLERAFRQHQAQLQGPARPRPRRREPLSAPPAARPDHDRDGHRRPPQRRPGPGLRARCCELGAPRPSARALSDTGNWTNQNVVFTRALSDMFPLAKTILKGALARDECRGAHLQAGVRPARHHGQPTRPSAAARPRRGATASRRTTASGSRRRSPRLTADGEPQLELRGRRHVADPAAAAALRPGRRRGDRGGLERAPSGGSL